MDFWIGIKIEFLSVRLWGGNFQRLDMKKKHLQVNCVYFMLVYGYIWSIPTTRCLHYNVTSGKHKTEATSVPGTFSSRSPTARRCVQRPRTTQNHTTVQKQQLWPRTTTAIWNRGITPTWMDSRTPHSTIIVGDYKQTSTAKLEEFFLDREVTTCTQKEIKRVFRFSRSPLLHNTISIPLWQHRRARRSNLSDSAQ